MSRQILDEAQELIIQKKYAEAYQKLLPIKDNPVAKNTLIRLKKRLTPQKPQRNSNVSKGMIALIALLAIVIVVIFGVLISLFFSNSNGSLLAQAQEDFVTLCIRDAGGNMNEETLRSFCEETVDMLLAMNESQFIYCQERFNMLDDMDTYETCLIEQGAVLGGDTERNTNNNADTNATITAIVATNEAIEVFINETATAAASGN